MHLLYPNLDYFNQDFHQDHLHPATTFYDEDKLIASVPEEDREFASDPKNWNSISNLQLLNGLMNESKNDTSLANWVSKNNIEKKYLFVNDSTGLEIKDFKNFIIERRSIMRKYLKNIVELN